MDNLTLDYLPNHPNIKIYQHKKMFRINTDTALLGEFLDFEPNLDILDIGTNNGALLLYSSLLKPKNIVGIDINNEALEIAKQKTAFAKWQTAGLV
jgi:tRNA1(Val) A37 N6-methylase TrmN6